MTIYKPFSLAFDAETTRPGEQTFAEPEPIGEAFAARLRDAERAGHLRGLLASAETGAWESARFCEFTLHDGLQARSHALAAKFYAHLYRKVCRIQRAARGGAVRS